MHEILTWSTILYWLGIILLCFIGAYLFFIFLVWISFGWLAYNGLDTKISKDGMEIFSKRKGKIAFYTWSEIEKIKTVFNPPIFYPQLILGNGDKIDLESSSIKEVSKEIKKNHIDLHIDNTLEFK